MNDGGREGTPSSEPADAADDSVARARRAAKIRLWKRRVLFTLIGVIAAVLLYFLAASFLPRWWAQRVGGQVDGSFTAGVLWGLCYGIIFTLVPILLAWQARRRRFGWQAKIGIVAAALVLAAPNLMTLSIAIGSGSGAHAGERILDVEAPAFRGATLGGVIAGVAGAVAMIVLLTTVRRRGRKIDSLERTVRAREDKDRQAPGEHHRDEN